MLRDVFVEIFDFFIALLKIDGFPGTRGTRSKEAPVYGLLISYQREVSNNYAFADHLQSWKKV